MPSDSVENLSPAAPQPAAARAENVSFAALRHRDFRRYFFFNLSSMMGDNIEHVISYWLLYQTFATL